MTNLNDNQPKTTSLSTRVTDAIKNEFAIEAQRQNISVSDYLLLLVENRQVVVGMMNFEGIVMELPTVEKAFLEGYAAVNNLKIEEIVGGLITAFIDSETQRAMSSHSVSGQKSVDGNQVSGLQAFTNVNSSVDNGVNARPHQNSQKTSGFVNKQKVMVDAAFRLLYETRIIELFNNAKQVIEYAHDNSGMMRAKLEKSKLWQILYSGFEPSDIEYLNAESEGYEVQKNGFI